MVLRSCNSTIKGIPELATNCFCSYLFFWNLGGFISSSDANHSCLVTLFLLVGTFSLSQLLLRVFFVVKESGLDLIYHNMLVLEIVNNFYRLQYSCLSHKGFCSVIISTISTTFSIFMFILGMFVSGCNLASE